MMERIRSPAMPTVSVASAMSSSCLSGTRNLASQGKRGAAHQPAGRPRRRAMAGGAGRMIRRSSTRISSVITGPAIRSLISSSIRSTRSMMERIRSPAMPTVSVASAMSVKVLKEILKLRKQDKDERDEQESLLEVYLRAMESLISSSIRSTRSMMERIRSPAMPTVSVASAMSSPRPRAKAST
jgi:hypothetical protein